MRIRTIKPEFWGHPVMTRQSDHAQLIAIGLLNYADDHGYFFADPKLIRSALRPFDDDSSSVRRSIDELSRIGYIEVREHSTHGAIGRVVSFTTHQRVDRPKDSIIKELFNSTTNRRSIVEASSLEGKGKEGNREQGMERKEVGGASSSDDLPGLVDEIQAIKEDGSPVVLTFPCAGNPDKWELRQSFIDQLAGLYPNVQIDAECRIALAKIQGDAVTKKTAKGMTRFLFSWMDRQQNSARTSNQNRQQAGRKASFA